jgi:hypothetical protein
VPFSRSIFEHFALLVNQMLTEAVNGLIHDSLRSYVSRFLCWASDACSPQLPPVFHVRLDAVGQAVAFNPPLEDFDGAVLDNLRQFLDNLSHTTGTTEWHLIPRCRMHAVLVHALFGCLPECKWCR